MVTCFTHELFLALYKYNIKTINLVACATHSEGHIATFSTVDQKITLIFFFFK